jgi:hypothetical protein
MKVVRVTREEFELEDGTIHPIVPPLAESTTVEEFQKHYDKAAEFIKGSKVT